MSDDVVNPIEALIRDGAVAHFTSLREEWAAARERCAVFPAVHRAFARVSGEDRVSFLQGMLTNDVRGLAPGQGCAAAFLTDTGKVVADLRAHCDVDAFDLDCLSWRIDPLLAGLDKFLIADDVEIARARERTPLVCLEGPGSAAVARVVFGATGEMPAFGSVSAIAGDHRVVLFAVSEIGGSGMLVVGPAEARDFVFDACRRAGGEAAGLKTLDVLRVEAGVAWAGVDMGEDTLLMEIDPPEMISRTKGCYLGQEVVERVSSRGQVNRTLTAFTVDADASQLPPGPLQVESDAGARVGQITSWVASPATGATLAMGLLHRKGREASSLQVVTAESRFGCTIAAFPRPRGR
jgi:folate-binding protein YgfZ